MYFVIIKLMSETANLLESLVKYDDPIEKQEISEVHATKTNSEILKDILLNATSTGKDASPDIDSLLNIMIPPIEYVENGKKFVKHVSHAPSSREDVINLQKDLDERLIARQAKDHGICPIREELHAQCFDEILRQVTIDCPERGLLLMRVRDEMKMSIEAYKTLYNSAVAFGMRKQMEAQNGKQELKDKLEELKKKKAELESNRNELLEKKESMEKVIEERKTYEQAKRKEEIEFLEYQNQHLKQFFQNLEANK